MYGPVLLVLQLLMITSAKYSSTCASCGQPISKGTQIDYQDKVARHLLCPTPCKTCGASPRTPGNWHKMHCPEWRAKHS